MLSISLLPPLAFPWGPGFHTDPVAPMEQGRMAWSKVGNGEGHWVTSDPLVWMTTSAGHAVGGS